MSGALCVVTDGVLSRQQVDKARDWLIGRLSERYGIKDRVFVRLKAIRDRKGYQRWLACYRHASQFRSGVIFWVAHDLPNIVNEIDRDTIIGARLDPMQVLRETLSHEYGHVIAEFARYRLPDMHKRISLAYENNEECFAEDIARLLNDHEPDWSHRDFLEEVIREYRVAAFDD